MTQEFAHERGGATLTAPYAGLFVSSNRVDVVEDAIRVFFRDFELDADNNEDMRRLRHFSKLQNAF